MSYHKRKHFIENSTKTATWKIVQTILCLQKIEDNLYWKMKFVKQDT